MEGYGPLQSGGVSVINGALNYQTQVAWHVNSATGSDANDGATALTALKTLGELERRWEGRTFAPAVNAVAISLIGTFPTEGLYLRALFTFPNGPASVTIRGTMTQVANGVVGAYAAWNSAGNIRGALTDAAQNFTAHIRRRVRITSNIGGALGGLTRIGSLGGGITVANVGQFRTTAGLTGANVNPAVNDTYVVETFDTQIKEYAFACVGAAVDMGDVLVQAPAGQYSTCVGQPSQLTVKISGCDFAGNVSTFLYGGQTLLSPGFRDCPSEWKNGFINCKGLCAFSAISLFHIMVQADSSLHDGNGTSAPTLLVEQGATLFDGTFRAFFGVLNTGQTSLVRMNNFGSWSLNGAYFWGATGNLTTNALWVGNSSGAVYSAGTVPKATGATPGVADAVVSNVAIAWAALPYLAPAPNNGWVNIKF